MKRREGRGLCLSCQIQKVVENDGECSSIRTWRLWQWDSKTHSLSLRPTQKGGALKNPNTCITNKTVQYRTCAQKQVNNLKVKNIKLVLVCVSSCVKNPEKKRTFSNLNGFFWSIHLHFLFSWSVFLCPLCPVPSSFLISDLPLWYCLFTLISIRVLWKHHNHHDRQQKLFKPCIYYGDDSTVPAEANL